MKLSDEGKVHWEFITGVGIGIEFFDDEDEGKGMFLDLLIVRILIFF